jgi:Tfp pilus assembly protein PilN
MSVSRQKNGMVSWAPKSDASSELAGSVHLLLVAVMAALFVSGGCYLYSVNQNAVQGYHMRTLEKEIALLEQKNAELRIVEADLRSLHRIEAVTSQELEMQKLENIKYREAHEVVSPVASGSSGPVALR